MIRSTPFWYPAEVHREADKLRELFGGSFSRQAARAIPPNATLAECVSINPGWWARYGMEILPPDLVQTVSRDHHEAVRLYYGDNQLKDSAE